MPSSPQSKTVVSSDKAPAAIGPYSQAVRVGDMLTLPLFSGVRVVQVCRLGDKRGPATEARTLYEEQPG